MREKMEMKDALGVVLDLASDNVLDEADAEDTQLKKQVRMQQEAMEKVSDLYSAFSNKRVTYAVTDGVVCGHLWEGGKGLYPAKKTERYTSLKTLMDAVNVMLEEGSLDSGMGFDGLTGALLEIESRMELEIEEDMYCSLNFSLVFFGDLNEEEKEQMNEMILFS